MEPPGATTMLVEETPEGTRSTLRSRGAGRWFTIAFLCVWIAGWAAGECFALWFLFQVASGWLGLSSLPRGLSGGESLVAGPFLLVWLLFWTVGGIAAIATVVRLIAGVDVLTLSPGGWTIWQGIGRHGRSRLLDPDTVQNVRMRRNGGALVAETAKGETILTTYGTDADRRWLVDRLRREAGLQPDPANGERSSKLQAPSSRFPTPGAGSQEPGARSAATPAELPDGYLVSLMPDGTTCITATAKQRAGTAGCTLFLALFWNGIVGIFVLGGLGAIAVEVEGPGGAMAPGRWGYWLFLTPFLAVGLGLVAAFGWAAFGREEWRVARDALEVRRLLPGRTWSRHYREGALLLECRLDSDNDECWSLHVEAPGGRRLLRSGNPGELRSLGLLLAEHTGWKLREAGG